MNNLIPSEEIGNALDNSISLPQDQHYRYKANLYPADRNLDRHIVECRNQQIIFNWTTSPGLHKLNNIDVLDSNLYFCERHIRQLNNGSHILLKKFDHSKGSIEDFKQAMIYQYESQMYGFRTCIINLSFSEN